MSDTSPEKIESPLVSIGLATLIVLPCLFLVLILRKFDGPGMGDIWMPIYYAVTVVCSAASALGFVRLVQLRGFTRLIGVLLLAVGLFTASRCVTFWVAALLYMPRH